MHSFTLSATMSCSGCWGSRRRYGAHILVGVEIKTNKQKLELDDGLS